MHPVIAMAEKLQPRLFYPCDSNCNEKNEKSSYSDTTKGSIQGTIKERQGITFGENTLPRKRVKI